MTKSDDKRVPALRFKGFTDEWEQRKLSTFVKRINLSSSAKIPNVNYEDISSNNGILNKKVSELSTGKKGIKFDKDDILFGKLRPYLNNYIITNFSGIAVGDFWVLRSLESSTFLFYLIQTPKFKYISNISSGSKMPRSDWNLVSNFHFNIPHNTEQSNIGKLLQLINNCITLQQRKLSELINLRLGILHAVFDNNKSNKKQIILSELGTTYSGLTNKTKTDFGHGAAHYVTYINVNKNPIADPREIANIEIDTNQNSVKKGDIFFTISSETPEEVGLTSVWPINIQNTYLNSFCFGFRPYSNKIDSFYLGYLFRSDYFRRKIYPLAQGISRYNLSKNNVLKLMIKVDSLEKQYKIKKILLNIDFKIKKEKEKINKVKQLKQFLLQNMFI